MKRTPFLFKYIIALFIQCISFGAVSPSIAQAVLFDFDNAPSQTSLPISLTVNGITAHFSATGQGYSIQQANVLGFTPLGFAGQVIYPNSVFLADLLIKFDSTLTDFSIMYSCQELGCDDAATMRVTAYMNGSFVGTNTKTAANPGTWPTDTLSCSFLQGFDSVVVHYDSRPPTCQDYGVIYMADNMRVTTFTIVPVHLLYFNCENQGNAAILQWKSADETNLISYTVQYAKDGSNFQDLAEINAVGADHDYRFIQQDVKGPVFYRLKISDRDGAYKYSEIKKLTCKAIPDLTIIPNPTNDLIQIYCGSPVDLKAIQILSIDGVLLKTVMNYQCGQKIAVGDLPKGIYILKAYSSKNEVLIKKIFSKM